MIYLLDTDIIITMLRGARAKKTRTDAQRKLAEQYAEILRKCREKSKQGHQLAISAITVAELDFGARNSPHYRREMAALDEIMAPFLLLDFVASSCAPPYGKLRSHLTQRGQIIGGNDMLIAAQALAFEATLVTNNTREFTRIPDLKVENWIQPLA